MTVSRNAPCPCGSGKKYKKCCGATNVIAMPVRRLEDELEKLIQAVIKSIFDIIPPGPTLPNDQDEMRDNMEIVGAAFYPPNTPSGKRPIDKIMKRLLPTVKHAELKKAASRWTDVRPGLFVRKVEGKKTFIENLWTGERFAPPANKDVLTAELPYAFGIALPVGDTFTFIPGCYNFIPAEATAFQDMMKEQAKRYGFRLPDAAAAHFLETIDIIEDLLYTDHFFYDSEEYMFDLLDEIDPSGKAAAVIEALQLDQGTSSEKENAIYSLHRFWIDTVQTMRPRIQKPEVMAAALHHVFESHFFATFPVDRLSKAELAHRYGVSVSAISNKVNELRQMINLLLADMDAVPAPAQPSNAMSPFLAELYSQFRHAGNEAFRKKTAFDMVDYAPEAYVGWMCLAEVEQDADMKRHYLTKASELAFRHIAEPNEPHLWTNHEARPYMTMQYELAVLYSEEGEFDESIPILENLMKLDELDHIGARYLLFPQYVQSDQLFKADHLLNFHVFEETWDAYSRVLLQAVLSVKELPLMKPLDDPGPLVKKAHRANPHVYDYLIGKRRYSHLPDTFQPGSKEEAMHYHLDSYRAWSIYLHVLDKWMRNHVK
ncbi:YecA family protein [Alkalicoccus luteus]|uniref:SEC-C domain-containing protein n=1 Tax=Alkalicoccus luteus TaxID=1237094 RepID=A0A969PL38_9BACI|nr:SEC-C domain-containing protein [Alkalicoccus luteus]NJP36191.1 SEC-C domain-containing protein [Alkalicoccus luteus]